MSMRACAAAFSLAALMMAFANLPAVAQESGVQGSSAPENTPPSAVSALQARRGLAAYVTSCSACHGRNLEGFDVAPALTGRRFDEMWRGKTAQELALNVRRMPIPPGGEPGSLSDATYADILAFILKSNGIPQDGKAGDADVETLAGIVIPGAEAAAGATEEDDWSASIPAGAEARAMLDALPPVSAEMLRDPSAGDWLQWGRTSDGLSFSPLDQINRETVAQLEPAWRFPLRRGNSNPMPLVHQGVMFLNTYPDSMVALDAATGDLLWRHRYKPAFGSSQKMGMALHGDMAFVPTSDLHLIALNVKTGELVWDHRITPETDDSQRRRYHLRSAPLVAGNVVIQGVTASSAPKGGFILAVDMETGREVWRFNTIARPGAPGGNTWNDLPLEGRSGGSVWHQGTYDADLNLVYFGIAPTYDTKPLMYPSGMEGVTNEALFTNCTVALNADTGELAWHYQHMANDQWDLDWAFERQIVEVMVGGKPRKAVMNVGKMAILEALDAATGEYLFSVDAGVQNVITAIDPRTGAKTIDPEKMPDPAKTCVVCPIAVGARSWPQTSYSPRTGLLYVPLTEWCMAMGPGGFQLLSSGAGISSAAHPDALADKMMGRLQAYNVGTQQLAWTAHQTTPPTTGMLATAGGLMFSGDLDPALKAFNDETGELLWEYRLDQLPSSSLVTYSAGGRQFLAVVVGLSNNHVRDSNMLYEAFRAEAGLDAVDAPRGEPSIWVFALPGKGE